MKYSRRSLMIVVALIPVLLWGAWHAVWFFAPRGSKPNYQIEDTVSDLDLPTSSAPVPNPPGK